MSLIERSKDLLITNKHIFDLAVNSAFSTGVTELVFYFIIICLVAFLKYQDTRITGNLYNIFCVTVPLIIIATVLYLSIDSIDKVLNPELRALQEITK